MKTYSLLPEQKRQLENLIPMLKSRNDENINFARVLILNEPLLDIILCKNCTRTFHNLISHSKLKPLTDYKKIYWGGDANTRMYDKFEKIAILMEYAVEQEIYYSFK